jgi:hypothetical protein
LFFELVILPSRDVELDGTSGIAVMDAVKDEFNCAAEDVDGGFFKVRKNFVILFIILQE